jgi:hypothetical protein
MKPVWNGLFDLPQNQEEAATDEAICLLFARGQFG